MKMNQYETEHADIVRRLAPECTVLLKKDGMFPLSSAGKIALYGSGARRTIKGGTGSGEVNSRYFISSIPGTRSYWPHESLLSGRSAAELRKSTFLPLWRAWAQ